MANTLWVSPHDTMWKVHWQKTNAGTVYRTKSEAITEAKKLVAARPEGEVDSIRVQLASGQIQTEWTYGKDPYPPKG